MTLLRDLRHRGARVLAPLVAAAALLSACGGGTQQVQSFAPARLLVLGDEASMIVNDGTNDGFKFSINDRRGTTAGKCLVAPTFVQQLASFYGMVFAECNPTAATPRAVIHARLGARVDDATSGMRAQLAGVGGLAASDMVTVMIGANDMIDLYERKRAGTLTDAQARAEAVRLGRVAAGQINQILGAGARALVFTIPDMGRSPYAVNANKTDAGAAALISVLSSTYNAALRLGIDSTDYDGRNYGLVLADDIMAAIVRFPGSFLGSPTNVVDAACPTVNADACALTDSTATTTLVAAAGARTNTYLWASDRHMGPVAHAQIGAQAVSRAANNPF
ncbi:MAG: SGNH/GDSL hydrolase family protein [Aquabacterium sp.]|nr:SGNH/GDSL hydrolase family protein [Aquabacterium sp.]